MSDGPSRNLSWNELACKDGAPYPEQWRGSRAIQLAGVFELIRSEVGGKPIKVLSAYRTRSHNARIGGARKSQHLEGRALDLVPPEGWTVKAFYELIKRLSTFSAIRGIGRYATFVHVDIRPQDKLALWAGNGLKDS